MSTDSISIDLQERAVLGKGLTGLRASGQIPAVIHDHGRGLADAGVRQFLHAPAVGVHAVKDGGGEVVGRVAQYAVAAAG